MLCVGGVFVLVTSLMIVGCDQCPSGRVASSAIPDVCDYCRCCESLDGSGLSVECPRPRMERVPRDLNNAERRQPTAVPKTTSLEPEMTRSTTKTTESPGLATRFIATVTPISSLRTVSPETSSGESTVAMTTETIRGGTTNRKIPTTTVATESQRIATESNALATPRTTVSTGSVPPENSSGDLTVAMTTETSREETTNAMVSTTLGSHYTTPFPLPIQPPSPDWRSISVYLPFALKRPFSMSHRICQFLGRNPDLESFECEGCQIEFFPINCLKTTPNLKELLIPDNLYLRFNLNVLFYFLPQLEVLDLSNQNFLGIEHRNNIHFPKHLSLKILKLNDNLLIRDLSARLNLTGLKNLVELELRNVCVEFVLNKLDISGLKFLEKFIFSNNRAWMSETHPPEFVFKRVNKLKHLDISTNQFGRLTQLQFIRLFQPIKNTLEFLSLGGNGLTFLSAPVFKDMVALKTIILVENGLKMVQPNLFQSSGRLERILLTDNRISFLNAQMFREMRNLTFLSVDANEFRCDCALRQFRDWGRTESPQILGLLSHGERCFASNKRLDSRIVDYETKWIECDYVREYIIAGAIGLFLSLVVVSATSVYHFRYDILWWLLKRRRRRTTTAGERYHAFVSYNSRDSRFTLSMIRYLEDGDDIRFKISFDGCFDPAAFISDCIVQCIERSEKIIFVISRTFLQSEWCSYELRMGELKCFEERRNIMILIFLEKIPVKELPRSLRTLVRQINYLQWPVDEDQRAREVFWKRLKIALSKDAKLSTRPEPASDDTIV